MTFWGITSFTAPTTYYRLDLETADTQPRSSFEHRSQVQADFDRLTATQVFYESRDGTRVPMFLAHRRDLQLGGSNPVRLSGYGGFGASMSPSFSTYNLAWMELGGVVAVPCIRGGGEYGRDWHEAGKRAGRQRVFEDFIAAAEWLIDEGYTSSEKLLISGGSNGGLLVGAVLNQRPDLFGAAIPAVGVMDMLRYHRFTIGHAWIPEYGSPDDPDLFPVLRSYSPLHNVRRGVGYPPVLVTTADMDDRVVPAHSFKYAAQMQAAQIGDAPILLRVETKGSHGGGTSRDQALEADTDSLAFATWALQVPVPEDWGTDKAAD